MAIRGTKPAARNKDVVGFVEPPKLLFACFLGFIIFRYLQGGYRIPWLGQIRFEFIAGLFLLIAVFFMPRTLLPSGKTDHGASNVVSWALALLILMAVMVPLSVAPSVSFDAFIDHAVKMAMMGVLIAAFVTTPRALAWFLGAFLFAFLKMAQEGVVGYVSGSLVWDNQGTARLHGSTPLYSHPNSLAGTQLGTIPFLVGIRHLCPAWMQIILVGQAASALLIVVVSGSRTAYVALAGFIIYRLLGSASRFKEMMIVLTIGVLGVFVIPKTYVERFDTIFSQRDKEGASLERRKEIQRDALQIFMEHPFGVGVAAFPIVRASRFGRTQDTHNLYLEVATNLGVLGAMIFGGFVLSMLRTLNRVRTRCDELLKRIQPKTSQDVDASIQLPELESGLSLIRETSGALIGFLVIRLFLGLFGHDLYEVYWWFAAGLTVALSRMLAVADGLVKGPRQEVVGIK
jgi:hypothetical protein